MKRHTTLLSQRDGPMDILDRYEDRFDDSEHEVYLDIQGFRTEDTGLSAKLKEAIDEPLERAIERIRGATSAADTTEKAVNAVLDVLNSGSSWTVQNEKIFEAFRDDGHDVRNLEDIRRLELNDIETVLGRIDRKYRLTAAGEGAVTGAAGLPGALADLPTIIGIALRAINEHATYFGFDVTDDEERSYALLTLGAAASAGDARREAFDRLENYGARISRRDVSSGQPSASVVGDIAEKLVSRLIRGEVAQAIPLLGAVIGGTFNRAFIKHVCETALRSYEQRWLLRRYVGGFEGPRPHHPAR